MHRRGDVARRLVGWVNMAAPGIFLIVGLPQKKVRKKVRAQGGGTLRPLSLKGRDADRPGRSGPGPFFPFQLVSAGARGAGHPRRSVTRNRTRRFSLAFGSTRGTPAGKEGDKKRRPPPL